MNDRLFLYFGRSWRLFRYFFQRIRLRWRFYYFHFHQHLLFYFFCLYFRLGWLSIFDWIVFRVDHFFWTTSLHSRQFRPKYLLSRCFYCSLSYFSSHLVSIFGRNIGGKVSLYRLFIPVDGRNGGLLLNDRLWSFYFNFGSWIIFDVLLHKVDLTEKGIHLIFKLLFGDILFDFFFFDALLFDYLWDCFVSHIDNLFNG